MTQKEQAMLQSIKRLRQTYDELAQVTLKVIENTDASFEDMVDAFVKRQSYLAFIIHLDYIIKQYDE